MTRIINKHLIFFEIRGIINDVLKVSPTFFPRPPAQESGLRLIPPEISSKRYTLTP